MEAHSQLPVDNLVDDSAESKVDYNELLKSACIDQDGTLRDMAIDYGADVRQFLFSLISGLWGSTRIDDLDIPSKLIDTDEYKQIDFLLKTKRKIEICSTSLQRALAIGPEIVVLLLDYSHRQGHDLTQHYHYLETLLKDYVVRYLQSHKLGILLEKDYLKVKVKEICMSQLNLQPIDFLAATGDVVGLQTYLNSIKNQKKNIAYQFLTDVALRNACYFGWENTAELLIKEDADVNLSICDPGNILREAIEKTKNIPMIKFLLNCKNIDITIVPKQTTLKIYDIAMKSSSEEIQKLFIKKKESIKSEIQSKIVEINQQISRFRANAEYFINFGNAAKASEIEGALKRAAPFIDIFLSVNEFLNYSQKSGSSLAAALGYNRLSFLRGDTTALNEVRRAGPSPSSGGSS